MKRIALGVCVVLGCGHREVAKPLANAPVSPTCLADGLGALSTKWDVNPICEDRAACRRACDGADGIACARLGMTLENQDGTTAAVTAVAAPLYERACSLGVAAGCTNLAAGIWTGGATGTSYTCLERLFEKVCAVREAFACGMVGRMLIEGPRPDLVRGKAELESSCTELGGFPCHVLAYYLEKGVLGQPETDEIADLMRRACAGGDGAACGEHATVAETFH